MRKITACFVLIFFIYMVPDALSAESTNAAEPGGAVREAAAPEKEKAHGPLELEGTQWQITIAPASGSSGAAIVDTMVFENGKFQAPSFESKGFAPANFTLSLKYPITTWRAMQRKEGEIAYWRGDFRNKIMKGVISVQPTGGDAKNYSFKGKLTKGELAERAPEIIPEKTQREAQEVSKAESLKQEREKTTEQKPKRKKRGFWF